MDFIVVATIFCCINSFDGRLTLCLCVCFFLSNFIFLCVCVLLLLLVCLWVISVTLACLSSTSFVKPLLLLFPANHKLRSRIYNLVMGYKDKKMDTFNESIDYSLNFIIIEIVVFRCVRNKWSELKKKKEKNDEKRTFFSTRFQPLHTFTRRNSKSHGTFIYQLNELVP